MPRRYIDLSMTLENEVISDPPFMKPHIDYEVHADTRGELEQFFPRADIDGIRGGEPFAAAKWVKLATRSGTHVDAPWHYHPTQDAALPGGSRRP